MCEQKVQIKPPKRGIATYKKTNHALNTSHTQAKHSRKYYICLKIQFAGFFISFHRYIAAHGLSGTGVGLLDLMEYCLIKVDIYMTFRKKIIAATLAATAFRCCSSKRRSPIP